MSREKKPDFRDSHLVNDVPGLQSVMIHILPKRTDCECYCSDTIDVTEVLKYLEEKNKSHPEYKTTLFHCFITTVARMLRERPKMNRYIKGRKMHERELVSLSFVAKRQFTDGADESLVLYVPKDEDNLDSISYALAGEVKERKKAADVESDFDKTVNAFGKLPRLVLMPIVGVVRWLDFWSLLPHALSDGDPNFSSCFLSNLGSIKCPSVYHHLNEYGTNSFFVTIGTIHKEKLLMEDGTEQLRDVVDFGAILDERIADGFYFSKSLKLAKYLFAHPEMLEIPLSTPSGYKYE